jgi:putative tricarboxylic transport membrane protein
MAEHSSHRDSRRAARPPRAKRRGGILALVHRIDLVVSLIVLAICFFLLYVTTTFEEVSNMLAQNIPPEFFPRLVLYFIALLALLLPFEHIAHARQGGDIDSERSDRVQVLPYQTAGLLILLVIGMPYLGTLLTMFAVCVLLPLVWGERRWKMILGFAFVFPLTVAVVFNRVLLVYFEPGLFNLSP